jgi:hypothetical protein
VGLNQYAVSFAEANLRAFAYSYLAQGDAIITAGQMLPFLSIDADTVTAHWRARWLWLARSFCLPVERLQQDVVRHTACLSELALRYKGSRTVLGAVVV